MFYSINYINISSQAITYSSL